MRADFQKKQPTKAAGDPGYDLDYDRELIEQSIAKQYHVLPSEQPYLRYQDWNKMVAGLMDDTPLGRIVSLRLETNKEILKNLSPEQKQVRNEWARFKASKAVKNRDQMQEQIHLQQMIAGLFGG